MGQSSTNAKEKSAVVERSERLHQKLHNILREKQEARRHQEQFCNRGSPMLKRLRVASCSAFRSASSSAGPIVVFPKVAASPTASSSTKNESVDSGCFLCPWSECVKQPAKSGYKSFDDLETHMRSVDCSRKGAWNPRFWHNELRRLWRLYGPEHVRSAAASVSFAPEAISSTIAAHETSASYSLSAKKQRETASGRAEQRLRQIVRQEVSQLLQPLVEEVKQLRRLVSRHIHTNEGEAAQHRIDIDQ